MSYINKPVNSGKIWYSPLNVYWHLQKLQQKVAPEYIEKRREYQIVREARIGAVTALAMFELTGKPAYIQLYKPDPPDVLVLQPSNKIKGQMDISLLEITTYVGQPKDTLLEQLKRTKCPPNFHKYSERYVIVVNVGIGLEAQFEPIRKYLNENKTPFPVWTLQQISNYPDTLAELVIINPETKRIKVNVGEAVHIYEEAGLPDVLHIRQTANPDNVRSEPAGKFYKAPWETIGK